MSLKILQPGVQPLGQFDGYDSEFLTLKGGEVVTFTSVTVPPGDKGAADVFDGYIWSASRPAVTRTVTTSARPLMLADDGITGYGTLFGTVVGGTVGQTSYGLNSTVAAADKLGPHTATGSGKVTCWDKPGLYAVSLDACDPDTSAGLQPTYALAVGTALTYAPSTAAAADRGLLTPVGGALAGGNTVVVGRFIEFTTNGSLVTTPNTLVAALNSPSGEVSSAGPRQLAFAVFHFNPDH